jgi:hypothetical protein
MRDLYVRPRLTKTLISSMLQFLGNLTVQDQ